jgi:hypothetical protein
MGLHLPAVPAGLRVFPPAAARDACRQLQSHYGITRERVGLFREGSEVADISCPIEAGAGTMVSDPDKGTIRFVKYIDLATVFDRVPEHASVGAAA